MVHPTKLKHKIVSTQAFCFVQIHQVEFKDSRSLSLGGFLYKDVKSQGYFLKDLLSFSRFGTGSE
jgi:hypothetical protein